MTPTGGRSLGDGDLETLKAHIIATQSLNITPDGKTLLILDNADTVHRLDTGTEKVRGKLGLDAS